MHNRQTITSARINKPATAIAATITTFEVDEELLDGGELLLPEEPCDLFDGASREGGESGGGINFSGGGRGDCGETGGGGENIGDGGELG